jgi:SAM-dependent methyltransferase
MSAVLRADAPMPDLSWNGHAGAFAGRANGMDIIQCQTCGFRHAIPLPTPAQLEAEYAENYYRDAKPEYLTGAEADQVWGQLSQADRLGGIARALGRDTGTLIEIGSGPGFFLETAHKAGWTTIGIEPSRQAAMFSKERGLNVHNCTLEQAQALSLPLADAIAATNVLEHLGDPVSTLKTAHGMLKTGGVICITVPNDYSPLQMAAHDGRGIAPWWIAPPHHLNYFDFGALESVLARTGFTPVARQTTFPMEAFLLMGDDYTVNPDLGKACHARRKNFDLAFEAAGIGEVRRRLYAALAAAGLGREATVIAVKGD